LNYNKDVSAGFLLKIESKKDSLKLIMAFKARFPNAFLKLLANRLF
jgi:hypothetical protein